jgi:hypothetical protein
MVNKKIGVLLFAFISLALFASLISGAVEVKKDVVSPIAISELNLPAIYKLTLTNTGASDTFTIYSLASLDVTPNSSFTLASGESKTVTATFMPQAPIKISPEYLSYEYLIKGEDTGVQEEEVQITYVKLKDAFNFYIEDINPTSENAIIHLENKAGHAFNNANLDVSSLFFSNSIQFSINAFESKKIEVPLDKNEMRELLAGPYMVSAKIIVNDVEAPLSAIMNFNEKEGIKTTQSSEGIFLQRLEISKKNEGNTKGSVTVIVEKNLFSALFTSFNIEPDKKELEGFSINYVFRRDLAPGQSLDIVAKTNWWILVIIIIVLIILYMLIDKYLKNKMVLKKRISLVRTKGGEFALKVSITAKARDFVEKIRIFDRLPPMVKVFERYGLPPDRIDEVNRRLEWNIRALGKGEERVLSYIVYSKIGVVGRFELPSAEAVYEFNGKIKEAESNRAFFVNEPHNRKD